MDKLRQMGLQLYIQIAYTVLLYKNIFSQIQNDACLICLSLSNGLYYKHIMIVNDACN